MKRLILFSLVVLVFFACKKDNPLSTDEQNHRGSIAGTVTGLGGTPLGGVNIGTDGSHDAVSQKDGTYEIADVPSGSYSLIFSKESYADTSYGAYHC